MRTHRRFFTAAGALLSALVIVSTPRPAAAQTFAPAGPPPNWKKLLPGVSPSARAAHAMAYDPVSKKVVLFGGYDATSYLGDTWSFDGTTWTREMPQVSPPPAPPPRWPTTPRPGAS